MFLKKKIFTHIILLFANLLFSLLYCWFFLFFFATNELRIFYVFYKKKIMYTTPNSIMILRLFHIHLPWTFSCTETFWKGFWIFIKTLFILSPYMFWKILLPFTESIQFSLNMKNLPPIFICGEKNNELHKRWRFFRKKEYFFFSKIIYYINC